MCPACIATLASIAAGATSTGSIAALVVSRLRGKENKNQERTTRTKEQGQRHGQEQRERHDSAGLVSPTK